MGESFSGSHGMLAASHDAFVLLRGPALAPCGYRDAGGGKPRGARGDDRGVDSWGALLGGESSDWLSSQGFSARFAACRVCVRFPPPPRCR